MAFSGVMRAWFQKRKGECAQDEGRQGYMRHAADADEQINLKKVEQDC